MHLPSRLRSTTLGDLLGTLHRACVSGTLELIEERGRTHRVHLANGLVVAVEYDGAASSLSEILRQHGAVDDDTLRRSLLRAMASRRLHGEVLMTDFRVPASLVHRALRSQLQARLALLERLPDAHVRFRVALRPPRTALDDAPLGPNEFLVGRRRRRDRAASSYSSSPPPAATREPPSAWRVLGLSPGADAAEIKRAYRRLARTCHPDLHPQATEAERRALQARFVEVTAAYRALVA